VGRAVTNAPTKKAGGELEQLVVDELEDRALKLVGGSGDASGFKEIYIAIAPGPWSLVARFETAKQHKTELARLMSEAVTPQQPNLNLHPPATGEHANYLREDGSSKRGCISPECCPMPRLETRMPETNHKDNGGLRCRQLLQQMCIPRPF
jgi:hypothetical protein